MTDNPHHTLTPVMYGRLIKAAVAALDELHSESGKVGCSSASIEGRENALRNALSQVPAAIIKSTI